MNRTVILGRRFPRNQGRSQPPDIALLKETVYRTLTSEARRRTNEEKA